MKRLPEVKPLAGKKPLPESAAQADWVTVGRIKTVFGVHGWLKVESFTQPAENILAYGNWRVLPEVQGAGSVRSVQFDEVKVRNKDIVVHLHGWDDREAALQLSRHFIQVPRAEIPAPPVGDYYWHQLEGLQVYQVAAGSCAEYLVGRVEQMLETGANDVLVVRAAPAKSDIDIQASGESEAVAAGEVLIPYRPGEVVKLVDLKAGRILVDWYYD